MIASPATYIYAKGLFWGETPQQLTHDAGYDMAQL